MRLAVETKENRIGFFRIDGRYINKFIEKVKRDIPDFKLIWSYENKESCGKEKYPQVFIGIKKIYEI